MPRYQKKTGKRKTYARRNNRRYKISNSPVPPYTITKLKFCQTGITLNAGLSTQSDYFWRANDLYDPDYSSTGHQPMGFDQWMNLYSKFTVLGSKFVAKCHQAGDDVYDSTVALRLVTTPTQSTPQEIMESNRSMFKRVQENISPNLYSSYSKRGHHRIAGEDGQLYGTDSASPANVHYYNLTTWGAGGENPDPIICDIQIEYIVKFFDPAVMSSS